MWRSRTKTDLMIEVWEKLDCESVGAAEIEAIETVVADVLGPQAVDSPMRIARLLADEGAELRHSEVMDLYLARAAQRPYESAFNAVQEIADLASALAAIRSLEDLRRKYTAADDREGRRLVREHAIMAKQSAEETASRRLVDPVTRQVNSEIAMWLTVWLQTPESFETWVALRQRNPEFVGTFGRIAVNGK